MTSTRKKIDAATSKRMAELGRRGGLKNKRKKGYFSRIAKLSHPKNNPHAQRPDYRGGRKPKVQ